MGPSELKGAIPSLGTSLVTLNSLSKSSGPRGDIILPFTSMSPPPQRTPQYRQHLSVADTPDFPRVSLDFVSDSELVVPKGVSRPFSVMLSQKEKTYLKPLKSADLPESPELGAAKTAPPKSTHMWVPLKSGDTNFASDSDI